MAEAVSQVRVQVQVQSAVEVEVQGRGRGRASQSRAWAPAPWARQMKVRDVNGSWCTLVHSLGILGASCGTRGTLVCLCMHMCACVRVCDVEMGKGGAGEIRYRQTCNGGVSCAKPVDAARQRALVRHVRTSTLH